MAFTTKQISVTFAYSSASVGTLTFTGLRVSLIAANVGAGTVGQMEMAVYGLSLSHMNALTILARQAGSYGTNTVTVTAGEEGATLATVFTGTIFTAYADAKGMPQVAFRVSAYSVKLQDIKPAQPTSMAGSADVAQIAQQIAQQMGVSFENNGVNAKLSNPYLHGTALTQMRSLAQHAGMTWIADLDSPKIAMWPSGQSRQQGATLVSPATGMVGYPSYTSSGISVTTYFNPSLRFGTIATVQSDFTPARGQWTIYKVEHELESQIPRGKWFTHFEASPAGTGENKEE